MPRLARPLAARLRLRRRARSLAGAAVLAALVRMSPAAASPGLTDTRHLGMGTASRASARGTGAMLVNPANLGFTRQFQLAPVYMATFESNTHGVGFLAMDSLLNARIGVGLGYIATIGQPKLTYADAMGAEQTLTLAHTGHEVSLPIGINAVLGWLAFGVRPKFQYSALRFRDDAGARQDARKELTAFGLDLAASFSARRWMTISVVGQNITGPAAPARDLNLAPLVITPGTLDRSRVSAVSDYPRTVAHGLAVFPTRSPGFSLNFDGVYDFTSYRTDADKFTRMLFSGGAEYAIKEVVPIRFGGWWDSRGRGKADDRGYIAFGVGWFRAPSRGGVGFDLGVGFARQVTGPSPDTRLAVSLGVLLNPAF